MNLGLSFAVVAPICIYILLGIFGKKMKWIGEKGINETNKLIYYLFFPTIIFVNIYESSPEEVFDWELILFLLGMFALLYLALVIMVPVFIKEKPVQGSVIQGIFRGNQILYAIPVLTTIYGEGNIGVAAATITVLVPFINILVVVILEAKRGTKTNFKKLLLGILKNPIIIGAILGVLVKLADIKLPQVLEKVIFQMSKVITPIALVLLGAGLHFGKIKKDKGYLLFVCITKLVIVPLVFVALGYLVGFREIKLATIFILSAVPTAVSSYVLAKEMESDGELAGEIIAFTSVFSIFTIFLWMVLLTGIGLII
ncbi:MAG: AEC family transporter [Bacilli bacterium]|jgi:predicted permease